MNRFRIFGLGGALISLFTWGTTLNAQETTVFLGAKIYPVSGPVIEDGAMVISGGKIVSVGTKRETTVPEGSRVVDATGKVIIPGLVDTHSHVGLLSRPSVSANSDGNEASGAVQPGLRAIDAITPADPGFRMALAGGVTVANIMPGSGNAIGGQTLYVKLRGETVEAMRIIPGEVVGGLKMANGENPKSFNFARAKTPPSTRMKIHAMQREQFLKARHYQSQWKAYREKTAAGDTKATAPETDISMEPLVEVLEKKRTVHFHCHRADDILSAVRLSEEFGFDLVLQHATEGYRIADELAKRKASVSLTLVDSPGGKLEVAALVEENAAALAKAGVRVAINTDDSVTESRFLLRTGAIALRGGMTEAEALEALTLNPAKMMRLDAKVGSLQSGKDADFVILSGSPFSVYSRVLETWIDGIKRHDTRLSEDLAHLTGGFALAGSRGGLPAPILPTAPMASVTPSGVAEVPFPKDKTPTRYAIAAGLIHTASGKPISDGVILINDGKIEAIGSREKITIPSGLPVRKALVVTPGLIDASTCVGISGGLNVPADLDQDEQSDPNTAECRVLDAFNPDDGLLEWFRRNGTTMVHVTPGRRNIIAGQTGLFRAAGTTAQGMALQSPAGILINLGETAKESYPGKVTTRMGTALLVRTAFLQAKSHAAKIKSATPDKAPAPNPKLEALIPALEKKIPVYFAAHRADDIDTALRLAEEFGLDARLTLATEAHLMADRIKAAKVPVVVHPPMQRAGGSIETMHSYLGNAAVLANKGIPVIFGTSYEGYVPRTRVLRYEAAIAMAYGLGQDRALSAITIDAAKLLGVADKYGSLEVGKVADLVCYDGDPFDHPTHVTATIMSGKVVYDREEYLKIPLLRRLLPLTGGAGVGCCLGW
jgi:imidazolonepropionase-like amidohydrolase